MIRAILKLPESSPIPFAKGETADDIADALRVMLSASVVVQVIDDRTVYATATNLIDPDDADGDEFAKYCTPTKGDWYLHDVRAVN